MELHLLASPVLLSSYILFAFPVSHTQTHCVKYKADHPVNHTPVLLSLKTYVLFVELCLSVHVRKDNCSNQKKAGVNAKWSEWRLHKYIDWAYFCMRNQEKRKRKEGTELNWVKWLEWELIDSFSRIKCIHGCVAHTRQPWIYEYFVKCAVGFIG